MGTQKKRIAILFWKISEPGGINTYLWNLQTAWRAAGHEVDLYHATEKGMLRNLNETTPILAGRDIRLPGKQIAYGTKEQCKKARKLLNTYDFVLMGHQCPHPDIRGEGSRAWQELYNLKVPILVVFHDNIWQKAYPWLEEVADRIDVCLYTNPSIWAGSAQAFPGYFVYTPQLLNTTKAGLYRSRKEDKVIWLPQWKAWKGIRIFVEALPRINYAVDLYNSGIEYHYLKKEEGWKDWIGRDEWTKTGRIEWDGRQDHIVKGPILFPQVRKTLKRANISVDLTGHKSGPFLHQTTYVHFESMVYGAGIVVPESVVEKPSPIPDDCVFTVPMQPSPKQVAKTVNWVMSHEKEQKRVAARARDWVVSRFDDTTIAAGIVRLAESKIPSVTKATRGVLPGMRDNS